MKLNCGIFIPLLVLKGRSNPQFNKACTNQHCITDCTFLHWNSQHHTCTASPNYFPQYLQLTPASYYLPSCLPTIPPQPAPAKHHTALHQLTSQHTAHLGFNSKHLYNKMYWIFAVCSLFVPNYPTEWQQTFFKSWWISSWSITLSFHVDLVRFIMQ